MTSETLDIGLRADLLDDIYGSTDLSASLPKFAFPAAERDPRHVFNAVRDELMLDGNSRQNLATFCQTWVDDEIRDLMALSIDKNMIDKDEYPQTADIEARCVAMLADLWNSPEARTTIGCSEAAMLGGFNHNYIGIRSWPLIGRVPVGCPSNR